MSRVNKRKSSAGNIEIAQKRGNKHSGIIVFAKHFVHNTEYRINILS